MSLDAGRIHIDPNGSIWKQCDHIQVEEVRYQFVASTILCAPGDGESDGYEPVNQWRYSIDLFPIDWTNELRAAAKTASRELHCSVWPMGDGAARGVINKSHREIHVICSSSGDTQIFLFELDPVTHSAITQSDLAVSEERDFRRARRWLDLKLPTIEP